MDRCWRLQRACVLGLVVAALGCAKPPTEDVFVSLAEVMRSDHTPQSPLEPAPQPPPPMGPTVVRQPGRSALALRDPNRSSEQDVRQAIAQQQYQDYLRLVERLRDIYAEDSKRFELTETRSLSQREKDLFDLAYASIREIFVDYGNKRGPLVADLTLLVGFPDPNEESKTPDVPLTPVARQRQEKARELRERIADIEREFDARVEKIIAQYVMQTGLDLTDLQERIERYRRENDVRAEREAREHVRQNMDELGLRLTEQVRLQLPSVPPRDIQIGSPPAPRAAPKVTSKGVLSSEEDRLILARRQLDIWASQNRYELTDDPRRGKDRTEDFIAWRNSLLSGR